MWSRGKSRRGLGAYGDGYDMITGENMSTKQALTLARDCIDYRAGRLADTLGAGSRAVTELTAARTRIQLLIDGDSDGYIYLASPYSHPDAAVRHQRWEAVRDKVGAMLTAGTYVYSPVLHCYWVEVSHGLPGDFTFWQGFDTAMISHASALWVYRIDGWADSVGVRAEIEIADSLGMPVEYVD